MHESQRYAAIIIDKILGGSNLDIAFENVFKNPKGFEQQSQTKAITSVSYTHLRAHET